MTSEQLGLLPEEDKKRIREAYAMGARACLFLAREIETLFTQLATLGGEDVPIECIFPVLEFSIDPAMQTMGDFLSNADAVDDEAEHATDAAFEAVRSVLEKYGHKN